MLQAAQINGAQIILISVCLIWFLIFAGYGFLKLLIHLLKKYKS